MNTHETETLQPLTNADLPPGLTWTPGMVDEFFDGYLQCALWSSMDESDESGGEPMDSNYSPEDIPVVVRQALRAECLEFIASVDGPLRVNQKSCPACAASRSSRYASMSGHGVGFWDRGMGDVGDRLGRGGPVPRGRWTGLGVGIRGRQTSPRDRPALTARAPARALRHAR